MHLYMYSTCILYMESGQPFTGDGLDFENWDNISNPRSLQPVVFSIVYPQHGHSAASCKTRWKDFYGLNNSNFNELIDQWKTENLTDGVKEQTKLHIWVLLRFNVSIIMEIYIYIDVFIQQHRSTAKGQGVSWHALLASFNLKHTKSKKLRWFTRKHGLAPVVHLECSHKYCKLSQLEKARVGFSPPCNFCLIQRNQKKQIQQISPHQVGSKSHSVPIKKRAHFGARSLSQVTSVLPRVLPMQYAELQFRTYHRVDLPRI